MKTINELNSKAWYRLLKVIYIIVFLLIAGLAIFLIFDSYSPKFDNKMSYVECYDQKRLNLNEIGVTLYSDYVWTDDDKKIQFACLTNKDIGEIAKSTYPNSYNDLSDENLGVLIRKKMANDATFDFYQKVSIETKNYKLIPSYTNRDWPRTLLFSLLALVLTLLSFELIKRVFYYVVLGSIRPQK